MKNSNYSYNYGYLLCTEIYSTIKDGFVSLKCYRVEFARFASKQLEKLPKEIKEAVLIWKISVELQGMTEVRKLKGYHDEPLKGQRAGQRSVRLNRSYRLIYCEFKDGEIVVIGVLEVSKHEY